MHEKLWFYSTILVLMMFSNFFLFTYLTKFPMVEIIWYFHIELKIFCLYYFFRSKYLTIYAKKILLINFRIRNLNYIRNISLGTKWRFFFKFLIDILYTKEEITILNTKEEILKRKDVLKFIIKLAGYTC